MIKGACVPNVGSTDILDCSVCQVYDLCSQTCFFFSESTGRMVINILLWISVSVRTKRFFYPYVLGDQSDYHV